MNVIKKFLIECGYKEELLDSTDVKFDEPKLMDLILKWQHQPSIRKFVEFAARFHLTPYSGNRDCLLFKLEVAGSSVRNTVIGGLNGAKQEFEFAGTRLHPAKINSALSSPSNWSFATKRLAELAEQLDVFYDVNEQPSPKYFWVKMSRPDINSVLEQLVDEWLIGIGEESTNEVIDIGDYFSNVYQSNGGDDGEWITEYRAYNQLSAQDKVVDKQSIKELWTKASTWVASIRNGIMSGEDYRKSEANLIEFTRQLADGTSPELYKQSTQLLNRLLDEGNISRRYWATTNRVFSSLYPQLLSTAVSEDALRQVYQYLDVKFKLKLKFHKNLDWYELNRELLGTIQPLLKSVMDTDAINVTLWYIYESLNDESDSNESEVREPELQYGKLAMTTSLNQILYGPPGTGKTYHTIEAAVQAADPEFYFSLNIDPKIGSAGELRTKLTEKYKELTDAKRIRFVTFHQSYGYEEFVEGLSATTTDSGQVKYAIKDGIFKAIADAARKNLEDSQKEQEEFNQEQKFDLALEAFKLSVFEASDAFTLTDAVSIVVIEDEGFRYSGDWKSSQIMKFEDLKCLYLAGVNSRQDITQNDFVSGLARQHASYFFKALKQIQKHIPKELPASEKCVKQNFVLVIDEINRGNISKIFGELITLIEPSKRMPADKSTDDEYLEISLTHSKPLFSVPDNLYLIGTMNTADRSLAMMDTALRRRFDFVEMMPKPELFNHHQIVWQGQRINLQALLETLNKRIEVLYDREHTLGHAFLFPAYNAAKNGEHELAFTELRNAFKNKIIPLLEEYFYEDWNKIQLVLGDSLKKDESFRFLERQEYLYSDLFGGDHGLDLYEEKKTTYQVKPFDGNDSIWDKAEAYIGIYSPKTVSNKQ